MAASTNWATSARSPEDASDEETAAATDSRTLRTWTSIVPAAALAPFRRLLLLGPEQLCIGLAELLGHLLPTTEAALSAGTAASSHPIEVHENKSRLAAKSWPTPAHAKRQPGRV